MTGRTTIEPHKGDKRYVRRDDEGHFTDEVERGEDFIKGKFESAFNGSDLPQQARDVVSRAFGSIKADHDEISRLKHQMN